MERQRPGLVAVTRETAALVSAVFNRLVQRGIERDSAQRFILQAVMAMFSEDIGLLPRHSFSRAIEDAMDGKGSAYDLVFGLFREMNSGGSMLVDGRYGTRRWMEAVGCGSASRCQPRGACR
jgi:hypothetical protein